MQPTLEPVAWREGPPRFLGVIMVWMLLGLFIVLALLAPIFGADSRDSRDWQRSNVGDREHHRV